MLRKVCLLQTILSQDNIFISEKEKKDKFCFIKLGAVISDDVKKRSLIFIRKLVDNYDKLFFFQYLIQ